MKFFFSSRRRHTRSLCDWSSDVCSSDLGRKLPVEHLCAVKPSLRHAIPGRLARGVARELRHSLAVGGVPEKFLRWIRSEERRVGKECRSWWKADHESEKAKNR